jgi:AcrR family transcriptional regulator
VSPRAYRLGRRRDAADRTRSTILAAARDLVTELGPGSSVGKVAERAGVSRITIYNQFGSKTRLLQALTADARPTHAMPDKETDSNPRERLRSRIAQACASWAANAALYRRLQEHGSWSGEDSELDRTLAEQLGADDHLRPGCSIKEAEDVIGILTSFQAFDRLHKGGRRSVSGVADVLMRMAAGMLAQGHPYA